MAMQFNAPEREQGQSKNFLKLKENESITGVFRGDTYEFHQLWENGKPRIVDANTPGAVFRFRLNLIIKENGTLVSKIFEQGFIIYTQLKELHAEYNLEKIFVKITRKGMGTNTTYPIMPLLKTPVDEGQIGKVVLQELRPQPKQPMNEPPFGQGPGLGEPSPFEDDEDIPF